MIEITLWNFLNLAINGGLPIRKELPRGARTYSPRKLSTTMNFLKSSFPSATCFSVNNSHGHGKLSSVTLENKESQSLSSRSNFPSFSSCTCKRPDALIDVVLIVSGPPLLLLGNPSWQTPKSEWIQLPQSHPRIVAYSAMLTKLWIYPQIFILCGVHADPFRNHIVVSLTSEFRNYKHLNLLMTSSQQAWRKHIRKNRIHQHWN